MNGIGYREQGQTVYLPPQASTDLDQLPFPAWELFPLENYWKLKYSGFIAPKGTTSIHTFSDHRIAMAMSIFALRQDLELDDADCVVKSFPGFWNELVKCNFVIK